MIRIKNFTLIRWIALALIISSCTVDHFSTGGLQPLALNLCHGNNHRRC